MLSTIQAAVLRLQVLRLPPGPHERQILLLPPRPQHLGSALLYGPQTLIGGGFGHQKLFDHPQTLVGYAFQSLSGLQALGGALSELQALGGSRPVSGLQTHPPYSVAGFGPPQHPQANW